MVTTARLGAVLIGGSLLMGCHAGVAPAALVEAAPTTPPAAQEPPAAAPPATVVHRSEFVAAAFPVEDVPLRRATAQFQGRSVGASLIHVPTVGTQTWGALLLALDDRPGETTALPRFFSGDPTTARLELRELHGELYAVVHYEEPEPGAYVTQVWFLHRIGADAPPRQVLSESVELDRGRCGRFEHTELVPIHGGGLDILVHARRVQTPPDAGLCYRARTERRRLVARDWCFQTGPAVDLQSECYVPGCTPRPPEAALAQRLAAHGDDVVPVVTVPGSWQPETVQPYDHDLAPWFGHRMPSGCTLAVFQGRLETPTRLVHRFDPGDISESVNAWIHERCQHTRGSGHDAIRCLGLPVPGWHVCGDLSRQRLETDSHTYDAVGLRISQANGASVGLLATLECRKPQSAAGLADFEAVLADMRFEPAPR